MDTPLLVCFTLSFALLTVCLLGLGAFAWGVMRAQEKEAERWRATFLDLQKQTVGGKPLSVLEAELDIAGRRIGIEEKKAAVEMELRKAQVAQKLQRMQFSVAGPRAVDPEAA